jgi:hypothetical protein
MKVISEKIRKSHNTHEFYEKIQNVLENEQLFSISANSHSTGTIQIKRMGINGEWETLEYNNEFHIRYWRVDFLKGGGEDPNFNDVWKYLLKQVKQYAAILPKYPKEVKGETLN